MAVLQVFSIVALILYLTTVAANATSGNNHTNENTTEESEYNFVPLIVGAAIGNFLPHLILVPLLIFFSINLVSGPGNTILFFYQTLKLSVFTLRFVDSTNKAKIIRDITDVLSLHSLPFRPLYLLGIQGRVDKVSHKGALIIYIITDSVKIVLILVYVAVIWHFIMKKSCPVKCCNEVWARLRRYLRNFHNKNLSRRSILTGLCSLLVLCYGYAVQTTFQLFLLYFQHCTEEENKLRPMGTCGAAITLSSIAFIILVTASITLLYYPNLHNILSRITQRITNKSLPRYAKLDPVFDIFQGYYKSKLRFYAGVYLLYRIFLWGMILTCIQTSLFTQFTITITLLLILSIHALLQPFKEMRYNYVETISLLALVFLSSLTGFFDAEQFIAVNAAVTKTVLALIAIITFLPLTVTVLYYGCHLVMWYHGRRGKTDMLDKLKKRFHKSNLHVEGQVYHVPPENSLPPNVKVTSLRSNSIFIANTFSD